VEPARVLVADPPWKFDDHLPGKGRGAGKHYPCMDIVDIWRFPLPPIADNAVLFLWRVSAMQEEALHVLNTWGFALKSELVWRKLTVTGKPHFGMGRYVRAAHETCLIATRGRFKPKSRSIRSVFEAPVGEHSAKPDAFYGLVEQFSDGPYVELFARRTRPGWSTYGNELAEAHP
jgi:site-specific DNA-methyltransferase (adenine-specific)